MTEMVFGQCTETRINSNVIRTGRISSCSMNTSTATTAAESAQAIKLAGLESLPSCSNKAVNERFQQRSRNSQYRCNASRGRWTKEQEKNDEISSHASVQCRLEDETSLDTCRF